ncbi:unnamed protein product [Linum tenue]|uniref:Uncharacterized protein n=1 Tax=Linum tenue TaxID=586396 RepID=A0AAV0Q3A7_9ROSI|nr:unnamed protein product [Linum tenue]
MVATLLIPIIYSWGIMLIVGSKVWRQYVFCLPTKSSTLRTSFFYEETMNLHLLTVYMGFMMNASVGSM